MKITRIPVLIGTLLVLAFGRMASAQAPSPSEKIPVKLVVVISRYNGDRKVSSLPFTLLAIANGEKAYMGNSMNIPISTVSTTDGKSTPSVSYTNIGTSISGTITTDSGHFKVNFNIDDKYVVDSPPSSTTTTGPASPDQPRFRNISFSGTVNLKEGEPKEIFSAADRSSGDVTKIDVTLTLDK
jgi:hypothetical protein